MMKQLILIFTFFVSTYSVYAQINADSLIHILETQKLTHKQKVNIYNDICYFFVYGDPDKTLFYAKEALSFAKKEKDKLAISIFEEYEGRAYEIKGEYANALAHYSQALDIAIKEKIDHQEAFVYVDIGSLYNRLGKPITSLEYMLKALSIYEMRDNARDKMQQALILSNIGGLHRGLDENDRAIYYLEKALVIAEELDYTKVKIKIYYDLGDINRMQGNYDKALAYQQKSIELSRLFNDKMTESASLASLALIYAEGFKDYVNAEKNANNSLKIAEMLNDPFVLISSWRTLSEVYMSQKRYKDCEAAAIKAWEIDSTSLDQALCIISDLALANIHMENKTKALHYFNKYIEINRQIINKNSQNLISDMEVKYETEKKEIRITTLEKEKQLHLWFSITGIALLLLAFGVLFYRHRLNKQKRKNAEQAKELAEKQRILAEQRNELSEQKIKQLEQEKQLIATQAILDGETAERSRLAKDLHDGLGGLLSVAKLNLKKINNYSILEKEDIDRFDNALEVLDQSVTELRRVAHHLMPESLMRYGLKTSVEDFCRAIPHADFHYLGKEARLDEHLEIILYRCVYELVNNAVKYAGATEINIQLIIDDNLVSLTVQDNGKGFDPEKITSGSGLDNIRTRVSACNGKMTLHSSPGNGTEINIEIENTKTSNS